MIDIMDGTLEQRCIDIVQECTRFKDSILTHVDNLRTTKD